MDLRLVREEAIASTTRFFWDSRGFVPSEDSDEWEAEFRRQFELAKARHAQGAVTAPAAPAAATPAPEPGNLPPLNGEPTQIRWAASLRANRMREIHDPGIREWLATTWTRTKSWIDTQDWPTPVFLQRIAPHYQEYRKKANEAARIQEARQQKQRAAAEEVRKQVEDAGITVEGLIELIDVCDRLPPVPLKAKLAELDHDGRNLRVFEGDDPALLMVLEKNKEGRSEYAVERDAGLVADLALLTRAMALSS
ncbi:MAG TPA: hypothetical protein VL985_20595 [Stellaceae bacterium]|nr:hypothetical protein [Stellaceae bacterium]